MASSGRCTSAGTGSTSTGSPASSNGRRSPTAPRSACTSRRAGCGRTSSAAASRSGATSTRSCSSTFPQALDSVAVEDWYRSVNWVEPSLIRVEADEATYNLHIILRFELEQELLADSIDLEELPEIWNQRMQDYLGVEPPDDALGVLQDMHWAVGAIGYFSTYALGNVISGQLWEKVTAEIPDLHGQFEQGEFGELARLVAGEPLAARAQVPAERADRADHRRRARPGPVPAGTCTASTRFRSRPARSAGDVWRLA